MKCIFTLLAEYAIHFTALICSSSSNNHEGFALGHELHHYLCIYTQVCLEESYMLDESETWETWNMASPSFAFKPTCFKIENCLHFPFYMRDSRAFYFCGDVMLTHLQMLLDVIFWNVQQWTLFLCLHFKELQNPTESWANITIERLCSIAPKTFMKHKIDMFSNLSFVLLENLVKYSLFYCTKCIQATFYSNIVGLEPTTFAPFTHSILHGSPKDSPPQ